MPGNPLLDLASYVFQCVSLNRKSLVAVYACQLESERGVDIERRAMLRSGVHPKSDATSMDKMPGWPETWNGYVAAPVTLWP